MVIMSMVVFVVMIKGNIVTMTLIVVLVSKVSFCGDSIVANQ